VENNVEAFVEILWKTEQLILEFGVHLMSMIFENQQGVSRTNVSYPK